MELRNTCLGEAKAADSQTVWVDVSSSIPHFPQRWINKDADGHVWNVAFVQCYFILFCVWPFQRGPQRLTFQTRIQSFVGVCAKCGCVCVCVGVLIRCIFWTSSATLTEVFPCFSHSCKANARVKPPKTGHGQHPSKFVVCIVFFVIRIVLLLIVLFCVLFVCKCVLPPGVNQMCTATGCQPNFSWQIYHII
jgi:hypothetical protein